jgi:hypothetical protein
MEVKCAADVACDVGCGAFFTIISASCCSTHSCSSPCSMPQLDMALAHLTSKQLIPFIDSLFVQREHDVSQTQPKVAARVLWHGLSLNCSTHC